MPTHRGVLRQTAIDFQRLHWLRVAFDAIGSAAAYPAFLDCCRRMLTRHT
jgi:hypothetical protein